ncbi:hypothetical protein C8J57DRAFT_1520066 [Mycena rebaudengoi]|nr:hypothetical protein C8J57DRAFT_1520066 [Mycena rebaudengoi]
MNPITWTRTTNAPRVSKYPILALPVEIIPYTLFPMSYPFLQYLATPPSIQEPPLLFIRVCRDGCAIALSTPQLWSRLHIVLQGDAIRDEKLISHLDSMIPGWFPDEEEPSQLFSIAVERSLRRFISEILSQTITGIPLPILERLVLNAPDGFHTYIIPTFVFQHSPLLS